MVQGRIFTNPSCPELSPAERRRVYQAFPATLAALHSVRPADVGLLQYGRAEGYAKRQVRARNRPMSCQRLPQAPDECPVGIPCHARGYAKRQVRAR